MSENSNVLTKFLIAMHGNSQMCVFSYALFQSSSPRNMYLIIWSTFSRSDEPFQAKRPVMDTYYSLQRHALWYFSLQALQQTSTAIEREVN